MGSDLHLDPPPPPPIHEQVRALQERYEDARRTIQCLRNANAQLHRDREANDIIIGRLNRKIQELDTRLDDMQ